MMTAQRGDTIGGLLRRRRLDLDYKQDDVAKLLGVNQSTVAKYERGDRIGAERLTKVAEFLGLDFDQVLRIYHGFTASEGESEGDVDPRDAQMAALAKQVETLSEQMTLLLAALRAPTEPAPRAGRSDEPPRR